MTAERVVGRTGSTRPLDPERSIPCRRGAKLVLVVAIGCAVPTAGCKSGSSMMKPSWWTFGGGSGTTEKLAAAPTFSGDAKKPSESNTPYPTTSTPNGYVIAGSSPAGSIAAAPPAAAAPPVGPVVYGSTPAPAATAATASPGASASGVAAQAGPYATLAADQIPPPGQPLPPLAPLSSSPAPSSMAAPGAGPAAMPADMTAAGGLPYRSADLPATGSMSAIGNPANSPLPSAVEPAATRVADARGADSGAALQSADPAADASIGGVSGGNRYASQSASRFTSGGSPVASPASYGQPPAESVFSPAEAGLPASVPPLGAPQPQPGSPGLLPPSEQPPIRRPDANYRPFKTGSYRPSRTILADETTPLPGEVRTASYDEPAIGTVQR